ncbi:hypothetical protein HYY69_04655 [Candidatus Woesearchaeota archaeon]|nr:hypothetical protein [Candidatus Woesearchaeota archaeon]
MFQKRKPQQLWTDYLVERLHDEGYTQVKPFSECERAYFPDDIHREHHITLETIISNGDVEIILQRGFDTVDIGEQGLRTAAGYYTPDRLTEILKNAKSYDDIPFIIMHQLGLLRESLMLIFKDKSGWEELVTLQFEDYRVLRGSISSSIAAPHLLREYLQEADNVVQFTPQRFANALVKYVKTTVKPVGESSSAREERQELSRCYQRPENADYGAGVVHEEVAAQLEKNPREIRLKSFEGQNIYELYLLKNNHQPKIRGRGYTLRGVVDKVEVVKRVRKLFQRIRTTPQDMRIVYQKDGQKYAIYTR